MQDRKTYTEGFVMKFTQDITKRVYMNILDAISSDLNELYADKKINLSITLLPEPISEGGMKFTGGKFDGEWYKSMRHRVWDQKYKWPRISVDSAEEWRRSPTEVVCEEHTIEYNLVDDYPPSIQEMFPVSSQGTFTEVKSNLIFSAGCKSETYLKAFSGAPVWTLDELRIVKKNFELFGVKVTKMPKKKTLTTLFY
jgi:hypothetical protein